MLVIREEKNSYKIGESNGLYKNSSNSYRQLTGDHLFNDTIATSLDTLCNNMVEAFHKYEQNNDEKISEVKESMLNKTMDRFYKTEQMNDKKIKQMIESFVDNAVVEEKFESIGDEMHDLVMLHENIQISFLKKNTGI
ncbi:MAG TPA: hypothetical protein VGR54_07565 [Nitrosopumilaceae archaeon]|nr:hypothetical protein [Nitrosopumilaceae archaeon]